MIAYAFVRSRYYQLLLWLLVFSVLFGSIPPALAVAGIGGLISEKVMGGSTSSLLTLASNDGSQIVGMAPTVTTGGATDISYEAVSTATLHGVVNNMNNFPISIAYFEWGYDLALGHRTSTTTMTSTGNYQRVLTGYDVRQERVFYRAAIESDGTNYGNVSSFVPTGGKTSAVLLLWRVLPIVMALAIVLAVLTGLSIKALIMTISGLIGFVVIMHLIELLF